MVEALWGQSYFGFIQKGVEGRSGGLLTIWDTNSLVIDQAVGLDHYGVIKGKLKSVEGDVLVVNIYRPHVEVTKKEVWDSLSRLTESIEAVWCLCGDFNEVRNQNERLNCTFNEQGAVRFNKFIKQVRLFEIPLVGRKYI